MRNVTITNFETKKGLLKNNHPELRAGDTVKVHYKIKESAEGEKEKFRIQIFEGVVIRRRRGASANGASVTVRKISAGGIGVERTFPLNSPFIEKIEVIARGVVRRARLYYLRRLAGKAARIRSQFAGKETTTVESISSEQPAETHQENIE